VVIFILGYSRLLSGDMLSYNLTNLSTTQQSTIFPETLKEESWKKENTEKKYFLNFPFYPFRTLNSRDLNILSSSSSSSSKKLLEFDNSSPLFPAHTQLNIVFQKRKKQNFLQSMLPYRLSPLLGSSKKSLTADEFKQACTFSVATIDPTTKLETSQTFIIKKIEIKVSDMYLQVYIYFKPKENLCFIIMFFLDLSHKV
jgi:hypothetical protein